MIEIGILEKHRINKTENYLLKALNNLWFIFIIDNDRSKETWTLHLKINQS